MIYPDHPGIIVLGVCVGKSGPERGDDDGKKHKTNTKILIGNIIFRHRHRSNHIRYDHIGNLINHHHGYLKNKKFQSQGKDIPGNADVYALERRSDHPKFSPEKIKGGSSQHQYRAQ